MKKLFSLAIVVALLFSFPCLSMAADSAELTDMIAQLDTDTLRIFASLLRAEYLSRVGDPFDVPAGVYLVGVDFPAGVFSFDIVSAVTEICVYKDADTYLGDFPFPLFDQLLSEPAGNTSIGSLYLDSGNILVVEGHVTAKPFAGLGY